MSEDARFSDSFSSFDLRLSKLFSVGGRRKLEPMLEVFNLFNTTNVLGVSTRNYSGYANVLARDSPDPSSPGYLTSSSFGMFARMNAATDVYSPFVSASDDWVFTVKSSGAPPTPVTGI